MGFVVKNTTFYGPLDLLSPHHCKGCGELGRLLCSRCKKYINIKYDHHCVLCGASVNCFGFCENCQEQSSLDSLVHVGERSGLLEKMVKDYKYGPERALAYDLSELLGERLVNALGILFGSSWRSSGGYSEDSKVVEEVDSSRVILVPLPTISRHIRERGFDHILLLAKRISRQFGFRVKTLLERNNGTVQVGASASERRRQARQAYKKRGRVVEDEIYVLIDDVWTTGASMEAAARVLREGNKNLRVIGLVIEIPKC